MCPVLGRGFFRLTMDTCVILSLYATRDVAYWNRLAARMERINARHEKAMARINKRWGLKDRAGAADS